MYSVLQAARYAGVSSSTIRNWAVDYGEFLSPGASPPAGQPRQFSEEDMRVFSTVAVLRGQLVEPVDIRAALSDGRRMEPVAPPPDDAPAAEDVTPASAVTLYKGLLDEWRTRADDLAERLLASETARAAAETELRILRELYEASSAPAPDRRPTFWEWVTGRGRK
ncbi:MAG: MerR family transcriptional regulator [Candidatus Promineofilum sp.]|mgnify:FL=1|nr:MerR family transcriptional regulator [Promineifilum sp.]